MAQIVSVSHLASHDALREFGARCLERTGLPDEDARLVADSLVESNLRGIDSHGIARLPHYLNRIRHGSINPRPRTRFLRVAPALGRLDGDHGLGQVVMQRATENAIEIAREAGAGWVAVENSSHCGALAHYGLRIARAGMIGFVFTHSDSMVVPHGARHPFCGTNPLCLVIPADVEGGVICLDMATSIVPWNTVTNAKMEGVPIPATWAVDEKGEATTDPAQVRGVRAFGAHKGSGLGLMIDMLCSFLLNSPYGPDIAAMYGDPSARRLLGGLAGAIDISRFGPPELVCKRAAELIRRWKAQEPADEAHPILHPGEPETATRAKRLREGVPVGVNLWTIFQELAAELNVAPLRKS